MLLDLVFNWLSVCLGIVAGTFLTWLISYFILKRHAGKFWKALMDNPEVKKTVEEAKSGKMFEHILEKEEVKELMMSIKSFLDERKEKPKDEHEK